MSNRHISELVKVRTKVAGVKYEAMQVRDVNLPLFCWARDHIFAGPTNAQFMTLPPVLKGQEGPRFILELVNGGKVELVYGDWLLFNPEKRTFHRVSDEFIRDEFDAELTNA